MTEPREIEVELGVPIPGTLLPRTDWTQTALKKLPSPAPLDWHELFGNGAPVVLDLGCGNGRFTISSAVRRPHLNHVGIDVLPVVIRYATRRGNQRGLRNVRFAVAGAHEFLEQYVGPQSVSEIHVYHPQPYRDATRKHLRLLTPDFFAQARAALVSAGCLYLQTDNPAYWKYVLSVAPAFFDFRVLDGPWPDDPDGRTRREIIARQKGLKIFRGFGPRRENLSAADCVGLLARLPRPTFEVR